MHHRLQSATALALALCLTGLVLGCPEDPAPVPEGPPPDWSVVQEEAAWWMNVVARADDDRWIVGGTPQKGRILRYDGAAFTEVAHGADVPLLNWVHAFEGGGLIVVGNAGAILESSDDETWTASTAPTDQDLWGVWGGASSDVWAVGGKGQAEGQAAVLHRAGGSAFEVADVPKLQRPGVNAWFKVWGSSASDVYIVGQNGGVLHWNGSALEELHVGANVDLIAVWGTGPDRVAIVGGRNNGVVALWNGTEWRTLELAPIGGLNGVWMRGQTVHAVGLFGTAATIDFASGTATDVVVDTEGDVDLHAVHGSPGGILTAVGGNFISPNGPYKGAVAVRPLLSSE